MKKIQIVFNFCKKPNFILFLILTAFFFKGVFLAGVYPMLQGQDEMRHYNTVKFLAFDDAEKKLRRFQRNDVDGFEKYIGSEEFEKTIQMAELSKFQGSSYSKLDFVKGYEGRNESLINESNWSRKIEGKEASIVGGEKLFHWLGSLIERLFSNQSPLFRFYSVRVFSVILGTLAVFLAYHLARNAGFGEKTSLILTLLLSVQPKFSVYSMNVNYDSLLIPIFVAFTLGGVLILKNGINKKGIFLCVIPIILGIFTKATTIVLLLPMVFLGFFWVWKKFGHDKEKFRKLVLICLLAVASLMFAFVLYFGPSAFMFTGESKISVGKFLVENLKRLDFTSNQYWGNIDWSLNDYQNFFVEFIWIVEMVSVLGLVYFLISKKNPQFLPKKEILIFLLLILFSLQFGVLFTNWRLTASGAEKLIASPGRYFIPNLATHIICMAIGLGVFFRREKFLNLGLLIFAISMFIFNSYLVFNVIIPRFYF